MVSNSRSGKPAILGLGRSTWSRGKAGEGKVARKQRRRKKKER